MSLTFDPSLRHRAISYTHEVGKCPLNLKFLGAFLLDLWAELDPQFYLYRALVVSKVDYCCSVLAGVSGHLLDRLQSILNAAARLVFSARRSERITPLLRDLYWLRVPERIQFRLGVLVYRCLNGSVPLYLAESIHRTADVEGHRHLRSYTTMMLVVPLVQ